jgi:hypothetical protein
MLAEFNRCDTTDRHNEVPEPIKSEVRSHECRQAGNCGNVLYIN